VNRRTVPIIGASVKRKEDPRFLTGRGQYVDDIRFPGMLNAVVLRSPHAHATIRRIDVREARALPGVALVATAADLGEVPPIPIRLGPRPSLVPYLQLPLARNRARYVGEPVALLVAADRYLAEDAAEAVAIEYDVLPPVTAAEEAVRLTVPVLFDGSPGNVVEHLTTIVGEPERLLANADIRIRQHFTIQRHTGVPLETRGLVASHDRDTGLLTVWGPTKVPHFNRRVLADLLGLPQARIRFVEPDVGGGFGVRGEFYPEDFLVPWASIALGRPVKWIEDRREHMMATNHSREQIHDAEIAATGDGRILALVDHVVVDMGAYIRTHGVSVPELTAALLPGPYHIPAYRCDIDCVLTNKTPTGTYRSPGRFEANFVRERMIDLLARHLGQDPAEIRRRNFITPGEMPFSVGTAALGVSTVYDTGDYASALDAALQAAHYAHFRAHQLEMRERGRLVGIGVASIVEKAGLGPWETARVEINPAGRVVVYSGVTSLGQGMETVLAQICAEELGQEPDDITVVHGDTALVSEGVGAFASRGTVVGGNAVLFAARTVKGKLLDLAARRLEASPADLVLEPGRVTVRGSPARSLTFADLTAAALGIPGGADGPMLSATHVFEAPRMTYPYGSHVATVEVDPETGQVRILDYAIAYDVGKAINPRLVEGQLVGGLAQGIGGALLEELAYDGDGQPLSVTFMDYLMPTAMEMPRAVTIRILEETPTPLNPLGIKGAGEGGTAAAGAAIANAVSDALAPWGVEVADLPLSPDRILTLLRQSTRPVVGQTSGVDERGDDAETRGISLRRTAYS
jgi:aerobic carbon-monoxide dehydrogenase large subunit